ncbi:hypothetical protein [Dyella sp. ASV21]|uniref:hypothetical protein n=1 Tax=Dyella sp. ASV21 TaxID=2795114 RepID=UPI0018EBB5D2|nr:hypothetical protein [Dyella sp. ASV21]
MPDRLEVYEGKTFLVSVNTSHAPMKGEGISIRGKWYVVVKRSYAIDYADQPDSRQMCCNIEVKALEAPSKAG